MERRREKGEAMMMRMVALVALLVVAGCSTDRPGAAPGDDLPGSGSALAVDGDTSEWAPGVNAACDGRFVYVRFDPPGEPRTLQANGTTTALLFDADADAATGLPSGGLGVDLRVELSPQPRGHGATVTMFTPDGSPDRLAHEDVDFHFAPTYAADVYEARVSVQGLLAVLPGGASSRCRGEVTGEGWAAPFEVTLSAAPAAGTAEARVPAAPAGCVRVVSWNILRGSTEESPEPFARVLAALAPDVVLVQEWDGADGDELAAWFNEHAPRERGSWSAAANAAQGVGVVTWHPIAARQGRTIRVAGEWTPRCCAAVVRTPLGDVLCASVHLKCCGSAGSEEDERRMREVGAIGEGLHGLFPGAKPATVIIGGDMNLVGSRPPVDRLAAGTDTDGSDLVIADPRVLGDGSAYTWTDPGNPFTPGRLDWVLVGDAGAGIEQAFVLDAARLSKAALAAAGIQRGDTGVSDHLPVVVDVRVR